MVIFLLVNPVLLIIDHGHFQYNGVGVALFLWAVLFTLTDRIYVAAAMYTLCILFKQTGLFYSFAFFACFLGMAFRLGQPPTPTSPTSEQAPAAPAASLAAAYSSASSSSVAGSSPAVGGMARLKISPSGPATPAPACATPSAESGSAVRSRFALPYSGQLTTCRPSRACAQRVLLLGLTVLATITVVFAPILIHSPNPLASFRQGESVCSFLLPSISFGSIAIPHLESSHVSPSRPCLSLASSVLHRMFPLGRGLFEDKVANFWCVSSLVIKWKTLFPVATLARFRYVSLVCLLLMLSPTSQRPLRVARHVLPTDPHSAHLPLLSALLTLLGSLPACIDVFFRPTFKRFVYTLASVSLSFFLFSFQVHEKGIIYPTIPILLLLLYHPHVVSLFVTVALHSLYPLVLQDGNYIPFFVLLWFWGQLSRCFTFALNIVPEPFSYWPWSKRPQQGAEDEAAPTHTGSTGADVSGAAAAALSNHAGGETPTPTPVSPSPPSSASPFTSAALSASSAPAPPSGPTATLSSPTMTTSSLLASVAAHVRTGPRQDLTVLQLKLCLIPLAALHLFAWKAPKFERFPDLVSVLFAISGFVVFFATYLYLLYFQIFVLSSASASTSPSSGRRRGSSPAVDVDGEDPSPAGSGGSPLAVAPLPGDGSGRASTLSALNGDCSAPLFPIAEGAAAAAAAAAAGAGPGRAGPRASLFSAGSTAGSASTSSSCAGSTSVASSVASSVKKGATSSAPTSARAKTSPALSSTSASTSSSRVRLRSISGDADEDEEDDDENDVDDDVDGRASGIFITPAVQRVEAGDGARTDDCDDADQDQDDEL